MRQALHRLTRREFLKLLSVSIGSLAASQFLAACGEEKATATSRPSQAPTTAVQTAVPSEQPTATTPRTATTPSTVTIPPGDTPYLVVARNGEPEEMVRRALVALGGIERFVSKGANVVIKPNICVAYHTYEYAATTNPWVVGALVKLCLEAGAAAVRVMDYPFGGSSRQAYLMSGIAEQVQAAGGEMVTMSSVKFIATDIPGGKAVTKANIFDDVLKADVLINVPIAKHHNLTGLTLGMKNLLGVVTERESFHPNIGQRLADLSSRVHSTLTVVDAVRMLMDNGPTGGDLNDVKHMNTIIVSPDIVTADSYAATLFGKRPDELNYITAGTEMGLGRSDLSNLRIEEINVGA